MAGYPEPIKFRPKNPKKYKGDPTNIWARSSWEKQCLLWFDNQSACIEYSSEELIIPYVSPKDGKVHRYFVDFVATFKYPDGSIKTFIIEVKPASQIERPVKGTKTEKRFLAEARTYEINQAKWAAAEKYAETKGWKFITIDEYAIGLKKRK